MNSRCFFSQRALLKVSFVMQNGLHLLVRRRRCLNLVLHFQSTSHQLSTIRPPLSLSMCQCIHAGILHCHAPVETAPLQTHVQIQYHLHLTMMMTFAGFKLAGYRLWFSPLTINNCLHGIHIIAVFFILRIQTLMCSGPNCRTLTSVQCQPSLIC